MRMMLFNALESFCDRGEVVIAGPVDGYALDIQLLAQNPPEVLSAAFFLEGLVGDDEGHRIFFPWRGQRIFTFVVRQPGTEPLDEFAWGDTKSIAWRCFFLDMARMD